MKTTGIFGLLRETGKEWVADKSPRLAAALAYYTIFSIAPLLVIAIAMAGLVFGAEAARGELVGTIEGVIGESGARGLQTMIENAGKEKDRGMFAAVAGLAALLFGASGVFGQLKDALNTIWEVEPKTGGGIRRFVAQRFLSFSMVLGVGFLLLASLIISAVLAAFGKFLSGRLPGGDSVWYVLNGLIAFAVITLVFALLFKYLPDRRIPWKHVWLGAAFTSFLFTIGKFAIGFYLGRIAVASTYGAAGSVVVLLLWIYYSGLIFFLGAEFTEVHARRSAEESKSRSRSRAPITEVAAAPPMRPDCAAGEIARNERRHSGSGGTPVAMGVGSIAAGVILGSLATVVSAVKHVRKLLPN